MLHKSVILRVSNTMQHALQFLLAIRAIDQRGGPGLQHAQRAHESGGQTGL